MGVVAQCTHRIVFMCYGHIVHTKMDDSCACFVYWVLSVVSISLCNDKQCVHNWQDYDAMIELVEVLPDHDQILKAPVQYQYAFALNRSNLPGYRDKALSILEQVRNTKQM